MPLVSHIPLPTFSRLRQQGVNVLTPEQACHPDSRELHVGLLNMMPDAAVQVTERQFIYLVDGCAQDVSIYVHPFSIPGLKRDIQTQQHIRQYYSTFEQLQQSGLDALIITGANVANPTLEEEPFWQPLQEVIGWAAKNVTSTLCSCLATHALAKFVYGIDRQPLPEKLWGVYNHRVISPHHPLLKNIEREFDLPQSRHNAITREQMEEAGLLILVESRDGGVHMAVSPDQFRMIYFQGHPENNANTLLKEYKREVNRYISSERKDYPPHPQNYFNENAGILADQYKEMTIDRLNSDETIPPFPEEQIEPFLKDTWRDTARVIFHNWLTLVLALTGKDRKTPFKENIDPDNPLGLSNK